MTTYTICIDPGFVLEKGQGAFGVVVFKEEEGEKGAEIVFAKGYNLVEGTLAKAKRNENFHSNVCMQVQGILFEVGLQLSQDSIVNLFVEHQISDRKHGHDLVWLTGVVCGYAVAMDWNILKLKRNMDCCRMLGIPVSKKDVTRERKKRLTVKKVFELGYDLGKSPHLADAAILFLSDK